jgi:hypothetical protein
MNGAMNHEQHSLETGDTAAAWWAPARGGRPRSSECDLLCALDRLSVQALPKDLPPKSTAHSYFMLWGRTARLDHIHHALYVETREREGPR